MDIVISVVDCSKVKPFDEREEHVKKKSHLRFNNKQHFARFIKSMYPDVKTILDVGTGGGYLSKLLKDMGYIVTAMDKFNEEDIKYLDENNIKYLNTYFDLNTDISKFDLVIGLHCCEACELVIRNCVKNDKEFAIVLCEVNQGLKNDKIRTRKQYIDYLKGISCKLKMTKLPIFEPIECLEWGETIYLKKERK